MKKLFYFLLAFICLPLVANATLYEYYKELGLNLPEVNQRTLVAQGCGIDNYSGTYEQNIALENCLRGNKLGANPVTRYKVTLTSSMTATQSTMTVSTMTTFDGHTLTISDLGGDVFLTIEPGGANEEIVHCTGISSLTFTGCTRGLAFYGNDTSSVAANRKAHNAGSTVVMSNVHYIYPTTSKNNIWTSIQTFASSTNSLNQQINFGTTTTSYIKNENGVLYYCNNGASCAAIGGGANTYSFIRPLLATGSEVKLSTSTNEFDLDGNNLSLFLNNSLTSNASGLAVNTTTDYAWTGNHTFAHATITDLMATNATTSNSISVGNLCFGNDCTSSVGNRLLYASTSNETTFNQSASTTVASFIIPANYLIGNNKLIGTIPFIWTTPGGRPIQFAVKMDSTYVGYWENGAFVNVTSTLSFEISAKNSSSSQFSRFGILNPFYKETSIAPAQWLEATSAVDMSQARTLTFEIKVSSAGAPANEFRIKENWWEIKRY